MKNKFKLLDAVAVLKSLPNKKVREGQVGTIVEILDDDVFEVEFADVNGRTLAMAAIKAENLLLLQYELAAV